MLNADFYWRSHPSKLKIILTYLLAQSEFSFGYSKPYIYFSFVTHEYIYI